MLTRTTRVLFSGWVLMVLSACTIDVKTPEIQIDPKLPEIKIPDTNFSLDFDNAVVTCSAMLAPEAGGVAISGQPAPIKVIAKGGAAPYEVLNSAVTFDSETVLSRTYTNNGTANTVVVDNVVVTDQVGLVSQCNFLVTVAPAGNPPPTLACSLAATPVTPAINQSVAFLATATGGTAPYTFSNLNLGANGTITSALVNTSPTANAAGKYTTSGLRTASIQVTDHGGNLMSCATTVDVAANAAVAVVAAPSTAVMVGQSITLTATPSGFASTPAYTFSTTRGGVNISWTGNVATVTSNSAQSPFDVLVTAVQGGKTATATISLSFAAATSLACSVTHASGIYYTSNAVPFTVSSPSGQPLEITYFSTHSDGTIVSQTDSTRNVKYAVAGVKYVLVQAKSKTTGALCQAGSTMSDMVEITPPVAPALNCVGYTSVNPSYRNEWFYAWANISGGQGAKWVDTITVKQNGSFASYDGYWVDANTARLQLFYGGSYEIKFFLKDSAGNTGNCTTTQSVWF